MSENTMEWIAHRGASADAPENTMTAIELAWAQGVDAVEIDVRLTRDGQLVLCHDEDAQRSAGAAHVIAQSTLKELCELDFGGGERIAEIETALRSIPRGKRMFVEIKVGCEAVEVLMAAMKSTGMEPAQMAVISFNEHVVREWKNVRPDVKAYWLADERRARVDEVIDTARACGADGVDLSRKAPIDAAYIAKLHAARLNVYVWTVDEAACARKMIQAGIDGITSNRAAALREELSSK